MIRQPPRSTLFPTRRSSDLREDAAGVAELLTSRGYETVDLTANEMAKLHVRHMVGGRAPDARHERMCRLDRKSTRLNSSHSQISYAVFCLKKKKKKKIRSTT